MKVYAHHDATGKIRSIITMHGPEGSGMMLQPKPGLLVTEIEGLDLKLKGGQPDVTAIRRVARNQKVVPAVARPTPSKKR